MRSNKNIACKSNSFKRLYLAVAFILLVGFAGKVYSISVFGSAGIQKSLSGYASNNSAQEDKDDREDSKFVDKQLTGYFAQMVLPLIPVLQPGCETTFGCYITQFIAPHFLTVPTPPPNC